MQTVLSLFLFVAAIAYVEYRFRALSNRMDEDQRDANSRFSTKEGLNATTERLTVKQAEELRALNERMASLEQRTFFSQNSAGRQAETETPEPVIVDPTVIYFRWPADDGTFDDGARLLAQTEDTYYEFSLHDDRTKADVRFVTMTETQLNKANNALNLFKQDLASGTKTQLTDFKDFPVREISIAKNGTISFVWKGDIYTIKDGQKAKKLNIYVSDNAGYQKIKNIDIKNATEMSVSPTGKEIALINRGELFVVGVNDGRTKRITNTPYQERMITWDISLS